MVMYDNDKLLEMHKSKKNYLSLPPSYSIAKSENNCGDSVLFVTVGSTLRWAGNGCFITTCAAEIVCLRYNETGQENIDMEFLKKEFIGGLPTKRQQCLQVVIDAYKKRTNSCETN